MDTAARRGVGRGAGAVPRAGGAGRDRGPGRRAGGEPRSLPRRGRSRARLRAPRSAPAARHRAPRRLEPAPSRARRGRGARRRRGVPRRGPSRPRDDGRLHRAAGGARPRRGAALSAGDERPRPGGEPRPRRLHRVRARPGAPGACPGRPSPILPLDFVGSAADTARPRCRRAAPWACPPSGFLVALLLGARRACGDALRAVRAAERAPAGAARGRRTGRRALALLAAADVAVGARARPRGAGLPHPSCALIAAGVPTLVSAGTGAAVGPARGRRRGPGVARPVRSGRARGAPRRASSAIRGLRERVGALRSRRTPTRGATRAGGRAHSSPWSPKSSGSSGEALRAFAARPGGGGTLLASALEEVRWGARAPRAGGPPRGSSRSCAPSCGRAR